MMRKRNFTVVLSGLVTAVLASSTVAPGCGGELTPSSGAPSSDAGSSIDRDASADAGDASLPPPDEDTFVCTPPLAEVLTNLRPAVPVDFVELRAQAIRQPGEPEVDDAGSQATESDATNGTPCATATNRDACLEALEGHRLGTPPGESAKGWKTEDTELFWVARFLVYTRGDETGAITTPQELRTFLGTIDTLEEARLMLTTAVESFTCTTTPFKSGWRQNPDGSWEMLVTGSDCGNPYQVRMTVSPDGVVTRGETRRIDTGSVCGRRPEGLVTNDDIRNGAAISLGAWLAEAAQLEAASVVAFRRLERELHELGAPHTLVVRARRSRSDEIRHAREMSLLAHRHGATIPPVEVDGPTPRSPFAIALENAVEGCVRETYGALVAEYQARTASDPELRSVLQRIARDEARHAALAHDVAAWLEPQLDESERAAIARARADAMTALRAAVLRSPAEDVATLAGMPRPREARALLDAMEHAVLSRAA